MAPKHTNVALIVSFKGVALISYYSISMAAPPTIRVVVRIPYNRPENALEDPPPVRRHCSEIARVDHVFPLCADSLKG